MKRTLLLSIILLSISYISIYGFNAGTIRSSQTICYNVQPEQLTGSGSDGNQCWGNTSYQWEKKDGTSWETIPGATTRNYQPPALNKTTQYRRKDTCSGIQPPLFIYYSTSEYTNTVTITVREIFRSGTISGTQTICHNTQPTRLNGSTAASGGGGNHTYQWEQKTTQTNSTWINITSGVGTSQNYQPPVLTETMYYRRKVTDSSCGTLYTDHLTVTVRQEFTAGTILQNQTICYNTIPSQLTNSTSPTGGGGSYTYQWEQKTGTGSWLNVPNYGTGNSSGTTQNYNPQALTQTTNYRRKVTDTGCNTVKYTNEITITVRTDINAGTISSSQTICYNTTPAVLSGTATSGGSGSYTYQWEQKVGTGSWSNVPNYGTGNSSGTTQNYAPQALTQTTNYRRKVTDTGCNNTSKYSNEITITVRADLSSGTISSNQILCYNTIPSTITGTTATGGSGNYTYQWEQKSGTGNWTNVPNYGTGNSSGTSQNYAPQTLTQTTNYRRKVTDTGCNNVVKYSNEITITVRADLSAGTISQNHTICYNTAPSTLTGTAVTGGSGNYAYQWEHKTGANNWSNVPNYGTGNRSGTSQDYLPQPLTQTTNYRRKATDTSCNTVKYTNEITITVRADLNAGTISATQTICYNTIPSTLNSILAASGGSSNYSYQWEQKTGTGSWINVPNYGTGNSSGTTQTYNPQALTQTTNYRRKVTDTGCNNTIKYSNEITITVRTDFNSGTISANQILCYNTTPATLTGTTVTGGSGNYTYQWEQKVGIGNWSNVPNYGTGNSSGISQNYSPQSLMQTTNYRRKVTDTGCNNAIKYSNEITITIRSDFNAGSINIGVNPNTTTQTICYNTLPTSFQGTAATGGSGNLKYQWEMRDDNTNWTNIAVNGSSQNYNPPSLTKTTYFRRKVTDSGCNNTEKYSTNTITITVNPDLEPGTINGNQTVCYNTVPSNLTGITSASGGGTGSYSYQWEKKINNGGWESIPGATTQNYNFPVNSYHTQTTQYRRKVTHNCGLVYSEPVTVTVMQNLSISNIYPNLQSICYNRTPDPLNVNVINGSGNYSYQWQQSIDENIWTNITNATNSNYQPPALTLTTYYRCKITDNNCNFIVESPPFVIIVSNELSPGTVSGTQSICYHTVPSQLTETISPDYCGGIIKKPIIQWEKSTDNLTWEVVQVGSLPDYQPPALTITTYYRRMIEDYGIPYYSNTDYQDNVIKITVFDKFSPGIITGTATICYDTDTQLEGTLPKGSGSYAYLWEKQNGSVWIEAEGISTQQDYLSPSLTQTTSYRRKVTDNICFEGEINISDYSNIQNITIRPELQSGFISAAQTKICYNTQPVQLTGTAATGGSNSPSCYSYQWQQSYDGTNWQTATGNATALNYQPPVLTESTQYRRKVTDSNCGEKYSNTIEITVSPNLLPGIIVGDQTICYNTQPAIISGTSATGGSENYTYQWEQKTETGSWSNVPNYGTGNSSGTLQNYLPQAITQTTIYRRKVTETTCNVTDYSNEVTISVRNELNGGTIFENQTICYNTQPAKLSNVVLASGGSENYVYQWQQSQNSLEWWDVPLANGTEYQPPVLNQTTNYRRKATDVNCGEKYSNIITITVRPDLNPGNISEDRIICHNTNTLLSGTTAEGAGGNFLYQWQLSANGINWNDIPLTTTQNYTTPNLTQTTYYRRKVTETTCNVTDYSNVITVIVRNQLAGGEIGSSQTVCYGNIPNLLNQINEATGGTYSYEYQWEKSNDGIFFEDIQDANAIMYQPEALTATTYFRRKVTDTECISYSYSNIVTITVRPNLTAGTISESQTVCYNIRPAQLNGTVATGGSGGNNLTYQWQLSNDGTDWIDISSATSQNYYPPVLNQTTNYRRKATDSHCGEKYSNIITITVRPNLTSGSISENGIICYNTGTSLTGTTSEGAGGNFLYQWQQSINGTTWTDIPLATSQNYATPTLTQTTHYRRKVTESTCNVSDNSNTVTVTVRGQLTGGEVGIFQTVCYGAIPNPINQINTATGGTGNYTYQWEKSSNGVFYEEIPNANTIMYQPEALTATTYFRRKVTDIDCESDAYSNAVIINVRTDLNPGIIYENQTICFYSQPAAITGTAATGSVASGETVTYNYQWQLSIDETNWSDIPFATTQNYTPSSAMVLTQDTYFRRKVTGNQSCDEKYTNTVTITVRESFNPGNISEDQTICFNTQPVTITGTSAEGAGGNYTYQWQIFNYETAWNDIPLATLVDYSPPALTQTSNYRRKSTDLICSITDYSEVVTITVREELTGGEIGTSQTLCYGSTPNLLNHFAAASGGTGNYSYQWEKSNDGILYNEIPNAVITIYQPAALTETTYYRRKVFDSGCISYAYSNIVTITVLDLLYSGEIGSDEQIAYNSVPTLITTTISATGVDSYQWQQSTNGSLFTNILNATNESYQPSSLTQTTHFRRQAISICGTEMSNTVTKQVFEQVNGGAVKFEDGSESKFVCLNNIFPSILNYENPTGGSANYTYQWEESQNQTVWIPINGATEINYYPTHQATEKKYFIRKVTADIGGTAYSNIVSVDIYPELTGAHIGNAQTICYNTSPTILSIQTQPNGGTGVYNYQWQSSINNIHWEDIDGAVQTYYQPGNLIQTTYFRLNAINICGEALSNRITLTVTEEYLPGIIGEDQTIIYGSAPQMINVSTMPSGGYGSYTYQWQRSVNGDFWTNIPNATNPNYQPPALTQSTYYKRLTTNALCGTLETNIVTITVATELIVGEIGYNQTICYGQVPEPITTVTQPSGGIGIYYTKWQQSTNGTTWNTIIGVTDDHYQPVALYQTTYFRKIVSTDTNGDVISNIVTITVNDALSNPEIGYSQELCTNTPPNPFNVLNLSEGSYTCQWQKSLNTVFWDDITGANQTYYIPATDEPIAYFRVIIESDCGTVYSNYVSITVYDELQSSGISDSQAISYNSVPQLLQGDIPTGGNGTYSYQWQQSINNGISWANIPNATDRNYQPPALTLTTLFKRVSLSGNCEGLYSNIVVITVGEKLLPGVIGNDQVICYNSIPEKLIGTEASGGFGIYSYQWQQRNNNGEWNNLFGKTQIDFQPDKITELTLFRRKVTSGTEEEFSNTVIIEPLPPIAIPDVTYNSFYCKNSNAVLKCNKEVIWYNSELLEIFRGRELTINITNSTVYYYSIENELGCLSVPEPIQIQVDYADTDLKTNLWDNNSVENGRRIVFNANITSNHPKEKIHYNWEFIHAQKGFYSKHYEVEPSQYFHWEGWHTAVLTVTTPNNCTFTEIKENLFYVEKETPDPLIKIETENGLIITDESDAEPSVFVFPNPFTNYLTIKTNADNLICEVYMMTGQRIIEQGLYKGENVLNTDNFSSGVYFVVVRTAEKEVLLIDKFVKHFNN